MATDFEKKQKIESWKRLGRMVLAILGLVALLLFFISYSNEQEELEKNYTITDEEEEILKEIDQ